MEDLSPPLSRAGRVASGRIKPRHWVLLFSLLQMGASSPRTTPFELYLGKTGVSFIPRAQNVPYIQAFFKRRPHLPRETIPAGTASYQSVYPCHQSQFEHSGLNFSYETMTTKMRDDIFDTEWP